MEPLTLKLKRVTPPRLWSYARRLRRAGRAARGYELVSDWKPGARRLSAGALGRDEPLVTEALWARLDAATVEALQRRIASDRTLVELPAPPGANAPEVAIADLFRGAPPEERTRLALTLGVHYGIEEVLRATGLTAAAPPTDVHAMAAGPLAAGGSIYHADLVATALRSAGHEIAPGQRALDFGCSSGRVVRVLAAYEPGVEWHGCDPNRPAVEWAQRHIEGVRFAPSPLEPPLAYEDESFDFAFAISIWSHFAERAALRWLDELSRVLRPGGHLVITLHGLQSIAYYEDHGLHEGLRPWELRERMLSEGFAFIPVFGQEGDDGIRSAEWGNAFISPEWLLARVCPAWRVVDYAVGRNEGNQDVAVLQRAP